jgi:hypothetical protein
MSYLKKTVFQKTFSGMNPEELDKQVNDFSQAYDVKASQFRPVSVNGENGVQVLFFETVWYSKKQPVQYGNKKFVDKNLNPKNWMKCADCGAWVLVSEYDTCKCGSKNFKQEIKEEFVTKQ